MTEKHTQRLDEAAMQHFRARQHEAVDAVARRFELEYGALYARFGQRGRDACREDLAFHLEFLAPALEFGLLQSMVDYLRWLEQLLTSCHVPAEHLALSLRWLGEFYTGVMPAAEAGIIASTIEAVLAQFHRDPSSSVETQAVPPWIEIEPLTDALLAGERDEASRLIVSRLEAGHSLTEISMRLIQPALYAIGERWQLNQVSVAQEHLATALVQSIIAVCLQRSVLPPFNGKRVLLACVAGNRHAVGLSMVANALLLDGWDVEYLGADVPSRDIIEQVKRWQPDLVGLSVCFPQHIRVAKELILQLSHQFGADRPSIMVGGQAFHHFSSIATLLGADAFARNAEDALSRAREVLER